MASETLIRTALQLAKQLGANTSKFMGTKSNVSFLGSGPKDGMLFQQNINPESFASIGINKVLPDIETSMAYLTGGKLNDIQTNKLIENMSVMLDVLDPLAAKNVVDASSKFRGGLESLEGLGLKNLDNVRAKSGIGERQATEAASDVADAEGLAALRDRTGDNNVPLRSMAEIMKNPRKFENEAAFPGETFKASNAEQINIRNQMKAMGVENLPPAPIGEGIMQTVPKADLPGKTGAAREFLVNALKKENPNQTSFADIVDPADMKFIMEGGGGVDADPIVLVQKYFGPRIAEMVPVGGTTEEIAIFTNRVLNNMVDAKGLKPTDPDFDNLTARFIDELADGGIAGLETRQGLKFGGKIGKNILSKIDDSMIKKAADDIFPTDDYKYDAELVVDALVENNPKLFKNLLADDLDDALRSELYGLAVSETGTRAAMKIKAGKRKSIIPDNEYVQVKKDFNQEILGQAPTPRFQLNVEKAVSELNIPREEAIRIAQLPSDQQKLALQRYMDTDTAQRAELMNYNPKTFDAAKGGLAKILEL